MVLASMLLMGVRMSSRLKKRSIFLGEILLLISQISIEIEYVSLPVLEIFNKLNESGSCKSLDFISLCLKLMQKGEDFFTSWQKALEQSELPLKKEEREKLLAFGGMLGTSDAAGQSSMLAVYREYFSFYRDSAKAEYEKYSRMWIGLGAVAGVGAFILLM